MAVVNGYCTLADLQSWNTATQTGHVAMLETAIEASSRWIDQFCQRHFWQASATARTFPSPTDLRTLRIDDLAAITSLKTDEAGDGTFETTWSATDYELLPLNPAASPEARPWTTVRSTGRCFPTPTCTGRVARVEITGTWGWPAVPVDVKQACLMLAARVFIRKESPVGVAGFGEFGAIRVRNADPDVMALVEPYRRQAVLVA